jgi:hypothetical protein
MVTLKSAHFPDILCILEQYVNYHQSICSCCGFNNSSSTVTHSFVAVGTCLPHHCIAIAASFCSTVSSFNCHDAIYSVPE